MKIVMTIISGILVSMSAMANQAHTVEVTKKGFEPSRIEVKAGEPVTLNITRKVEVTCAKKVSIPSEGIEKDLPLNKIVRVSFTPKKRGEIAFGCAMKQMLGGVIIVN